MPTLGLQLGHVARRTGATGTAGEQDFARLAAKAVQLALKGTAWKVRVLYADAATASYSGLDAFAAVHCDGSTSATARGASVGHRTTEGRLLGARWMLAYERRGWPSFRSPNYTPALASYYGVRKAVEQGCRAAFIIEAGFMTNSQGARPTDRELLRGSNGPQRVALALADALGVTRIPTKPPIPSPEDDMPSPADYAQAVYDKVAPVVNNVMSEVKEVGKQASSAFTNARLAAHGVAEVKGEVAALREEMRQLSSGEGPDFDKITAAAEAGARGAFEDVELVIRERGES